MQDINGRMKICLDRCAGGGDLRRAGHRVSIEQAVSFQNELEVAASEVDGNRMMIGVAAMRDWRLARGVCPPARDQ